MGFIEITAAPRRTQQGGIILCVMLHKNGIAYAQPGGIPCGIVFDRQTFVPGFKLPLLPTLYLLKLSTNEMNVKLLAFKYELYALSFTLKQPIAASTLFAAQLLAMHQIINGAPL